MCLAIPARVVELRDGDKAVIDLGGLRKEVSTAFLESVQLDDYVIIHVGYAIGKLDPDEALRTIAMFNEMAGIAADGAEQA